MPLFVTKFKFVDPASRQSKKVSAGVEEAARKLEAAGGKFLGFFPTLGEYDYIAISEVPEDKAEVLIKSGLEALGELRVSTMKTFTADQFASWVNK